MLVHISQTSHFSRIIAETFNQESGNSRIPNAKVHFNNMYNENVKLTVHMLGCQPKFCYSLKYRDYYVSLTYLFTLRMSIVNTDLCSGMNLQV